jgi:hypothetical protein
MGLKGLSSDIQGLESGENRKVFLKSTNASTFEFLKMVLISDCKHKVQLLLNLSGLELKMKSKGVKGTIGSGRGK